MIPRMKIINKYGINCIELFKEKCKLYITSIYKKNYFSDKMPLCFTNISHFVTTYGSELTIDPFLPIHFDSKTTITGKYYI